MTEFNKNGLKKLAVPPSMYIKLFLKIITLLFDVTIQTSIRNNSTKKLSYA